MTPTNFEIAEFLESHALLLEVEDASPFRVRAYKNAADTIRSQTDPVSEMVSRSEDLTDLQDVGPATAKKIEEIVALGQEAYLAKLHAETSPGLLDMLRVPGLGPKRVRTLRDALGVESVEELERAGEEERIRSIPGFGAKTEEQILRRLRRRRQDG